MVQVKNNTMQDTDVTHMAFLTIMFNISFVKVMICKINLSICMNLVHFELEKVDRPNTYTAILLTNGLRIVYRSLPQFLPLVYPGWGQKSEFFAS